jgi:stearoyl-CoA desaturase (delta-9 desaturase)
MQLLDSAVIDALIDWMAHGLFDLAWWQIILVMLGLTHITIVSVTIYLHRHSAHRALDLHPIPAHLFRFWLWMTTGQLTKEWTAIHRKHHAKCERDGDPHSPQLYGIKTVFWQGAELYRVEAKNRDTLERYGHNTPDDWIERHLYTPYSALGVSLMLIIDIALFGFIGLTVWAVQMLWIPVTAAGIINGFGHWWGYRNFEAHDASTNISPWGIIIGGEELHNNHHTYPTSAKLSVKPYEFDIGWMYISILSALGLARVKKTPPRAAYGDVRPVADEKTLEALIANRYEVMAQYARGLRKLVAQEAAKLGDARVLRDTSRWMHRDTEKVPAEAQARLAQARQASPALDKMVHMREELRQIWLNTSHSREQLAAVIGIQAICRAHTARPAAPNSARSMIIMMPTPCHE